MDGSLAPRWVVFSFTGLVAWNVFAVVSLYAMIGFAVALPRLDIGLEYGGLGFAVVAATAMIIGLVSALVVARRLRAWFATRLRRRAYVLLAVLVVLTLLAFPQPFTYMVY